MDRKYILLKEEHMDKELLEAFEKLKNNCKSENCDVNKCPFAYKDYDTHCKLGGKERKPRILENEANGVKFEVHKHMYYGNM